MAVPTVFDSNTRHNTRHLSQLMQKSRYSANNGQPLSSKALNLSEPSENLTIGSERPTASGRSFLSKHYIRKLKAIKRTNPRRNSKSPENEPVLPRELHHSKRNSVEQSSLPYQTFEESNKFGMRVKEERLHSNGEKLIVSSIECRDSPPPTPIKVERSSFEDFHLALKEKSAPLFVDDFEKSEYDIGNAPLFRKEAEKSSSYSPSQEPFSSNESHENDFEEDQRNPDPERRAVIPRSRHYSLKKYNPSSSTRSEVCQTLERANSSGNSEDEIEQASNPSFNQVSKMAKKIAAQSRANSSGAQIRVPWSHNDEQLLRNGIEEHGCSWSQLSNSIYGWDKRRDQVALKDKARNMKVAYLKAGVPLPLNFDKVRLGKKEIASVRTVIPDYEPDE